MSRFSRPSAGVLLAVAVVPVVAQPVGAAIGHQPRVARTATLADVRLAEFQNALLPGSITNDRGIRFGSLGSDIFRRHGDPGNEFWMVTDRGPNGQPSGKRTFPVPEFDPTIVHVKVHGDRIEVLGALPLLTTNGTPVTGLPNVAVFDETPWSYNAMATLAVNPNGLDTEGIVRTGAGDFWLVEEYSPSLVHVDATGHVLERIVPVNSQLSGTGYPVTKSLPEIFNKRRQNRGFEGLAISPDDSTLFLALQSPLENPNKTIGRASRNTRILRFDIATRTVTGEFVYRLDEACAFVGQPAGCTSAKPGDMKVSGLAALSATELLVDERTDDVAKITLVDLAAATDILGTAWDSLATNPSLESLADPASAGITVLPKTLIVDLSALPGIPKKIEGVTVVNPVTLAISNDNDFGLVDETTFDTAGSLTNDSGARSQILYIKLAEPLP